MPLLLKLISHLLPGMCLGPQEVSVLPYPHLLSCSLSLWLSEGCLFVCCHS